MTLPLFSDATTAPGMLVTIDGPNGSGKTSLVAAVARQLEASGEQVHSTQQPSPSEVGSFTRGAESTMSGRAFACLVAADRHDQTLRELAPALARGFLVVCDRYVESSLVLQRLDAVELEFILAVNSGIFQPDLRIRLEAEPDVLTERRAARGVPAGRRFERLPNGPLHELALYAEADALLSQTYGLPSLMFDTSRTKADGLAAEVVGAIKAQRREQQ